MAGMRALWAAIDGDNLPRWEQSIVIKQMTAILAEPRSSPSHRLDARLIVEAAGSFHDE